MALAPPPPAPGSALVATMAEAPGTRAPEPAGSTGARAARGAAILVAVRLALHAAGFAQSVVVARWISPADLGVYAFALAVAGILSRAKQVGSTEKLIRDTEADLERSFSAAFAVELGLACAAFAVVAAGAWLLAGWAADPRLPLATVLVGASFFRQVADLPTVLFHRRFEFGIPGLRRLLAAAAGVVATIALAFAGLGMWSLPLGQAVGVVASAALLWPSAPLRPSLRLEPRAVRAYVTFGMPLWGLGFLASAAERGATFAIASSLGWAVLGYVHLAEALTSRLSQASEAVNAAIYPALRATGATAERLRSVVDQSNRLFALGGVPLGAGLALFAPDYVPWLFGPAWTAAIPFVSASCLFWGFTTIGSAAHLPFLTRGETRPLLAFGAVNFAARLAVTVVGVLFFGIEGLLAAILFSIFLAIDVRTRMLRGIFSDVSLLGGALTPTLITAAAVAAVRGLEATGNAWAGWLPARVVAFGALVAMGATLFDRATVEKAISAAARGLRRGSPSPRPIGPAVDDRGQPW